MIFYKSFIFYFTALCINTISHKEIFDFNADDILESEIGDIYEARSLLNKITEGPDVYTTPLNIGGTPSDNDIRKINVSTPKPRRAYPTNFNVTTDRIMVATTPFDFKLFKNLTLKELKIRRYRRMIEHVLSNDFQVITDFTSDAHDPDQITRRFDQIVKKGQKELSHKTRRETYHGKVDQEERYHQKVRTFRLMEHFIYETRYKMVFSQILRNKYINSHRYKLGYAFALIRHLKSMQKWLYWSIKSWNEYIETQYFNLKMLEKIMRLDVDIKNVIKLIRRLDYERKILYNPRYYDYSEEVTTENPIMDMPDEYGRTMTPRIDDG